MREYRLRSQNKIPIATENVSLQINAVYTVDLVGWLFWV